MSDEVKLLPCAHCAEAFRDGLLAAEKMVRRYMGEQYGEDSALIIDVDEGIQADKPTLAYVAESLARRAARAIEATRPTEQGLGVPYGTGHSRAEPEEVSVVPTSVPNAVMPFPERRPVYRWQIDSAYSSGDDRSSEAWQTVGWLHD